MENISNMVVEKFLRYVKIDTQSVEDSSTFPSTNKQCDLARILENEMKNLGFTNVTLDENCYVMATLPSNVTRPLPTIGWIAHLDTNQEISGAKVKPKIITNYDGGDVIINKEKHTVLSPSEFPELKNYIGETIITTDGTTLLGADDKAGIAEIMTALEYLSKHPEIEHGTLRIAFTPDEEIGRSPERFNVKKFNADFAYTVDGGQIGEVVYETFNAVNIYITIHGINVHPGEAKDKLVNSMLIANELVSMFPTNQRPENTSGYAGYYHLEKFTGTVEKTTLKFLVRDFDNDLFETRKNLVIKAVEFLNQKYGAGTVEIDIRHMYSNMKDCIKPVMHLIDNAVNAMRELGITPKIIPVRGGTDGARLSFMGLPTPNLFTGGHNFHSRFEYIPINSMVKAVELIIKIIIIYTSEKVTKNG